MVSLDPGKLCTHLLLSLVCDCLLSFFEALHIFHVILSLELIFGLLIIAPHISLGKKKKHQDLCSRWNSCSNCRHKLSGLILGAFSNVFLLVKAAKHPAWHKWVWAHYILGKTLFYNFLCSVAELWLLH